MLSTVPTGKYLSTPVALVRFLIIVGKLPCYSSAGNLGVFIYEGLLEWNILRGLYNFTVDTMEIPLPEIPGIFSSAFFILCFLHVCPKKNVLCSAFM